MSSDNLTKNTDDHGLLLQLVAMFREFDSHQREFGEGLQGLTERLQAVGERLQALDDRLQGLTERLQAVGERLQAFDDRLQAFDDRLQDLDERLQALEKKVDERLYDTRPMWEAVQLQISELREETAKGFRKLDSKWEMLAREVRDLYADERELERRVGNLEPKVS